MGTEFEPGEGMRLQKFTMHALISPNLVKLFPTWWVNLWGGAFGGDPVDLSTGLTIKDARGIVFLTNEYDANSRVTKQTQADATTYLFAYTLRRRRQGHADRSHEPRRVSRGARYVRTAMPTGAA